jgi:hypothetical protein
MAVWEGIFLGYRNIFVDGLYNSVREGVVFVGAHTENGQQTQRVHMVVLPHPKSLRNTNSHPKIFPS